MIIEIEFTYKLTSYINDSERKYRVDNLIIKDEIIKDKQSKNGVIYILTNPFFPKYVKIGYSDNVNKRIEELNRSKCIPFAFRLYAYYKVENRISDTKFTKKLHLIINYKECKREEYM